MAEEKKEFQTDATTGVKIVGGTPVTETKGVKVVGGGKVPDEITIIDKKPEPKS